MDIQILQVDNGFIIEIDCPSLPPGGSMTATMAKKKKKMVCKTIDELLDLIKFTYG